MVFFSVARLLRRFRLFLIVWFSLSCVSAARPLRWFRLFLVVRVVRVGFGRAAVAVISCCFCLFRRRWFQSRPDSVVSLFFIIAWRWFRCWGLGAKKAAAKRAAAKKSGGEKVGGGKVHSRRFRFPDGVQMCLVGCITPTGWDILIGWFA